MTQTASMLRKVGSAISISVLASVGLCLRLCLCLRLRLCFSVALTLSVATSIGRLTCLVVPIDILGVVSQPSQPVTDILSGLSFSVSFCQSLSLSAF